MCVCVFIEYLTHLGILKYYENIQDKLTKSIL